MATEIYSELQKRLDLYSIGFPSTNSGVEIKILKKLFSEEDANIFLDLTHLMEPPEAVARKLGLSITEAKDKLADMAKRGLLFSRKENNRTLYGTTPFVHGIFEYQVNRMDKELAELMDQYNTEAIEPSMAKHGGSFLRTIPVQKSLEVENNVASYDDAVEFLKSRKTIAIANCICRTTKNALDQGCDKLLETCFMFNTMAEFYIENNLGRQITYEEAVAILTKGQKEGLVTQPATSQNPAGMCLCCGDCCGVLLGIKSHPRPAEIVSSNHYVSLDNSNCTGCEVCIKRCQMDALSMNENGLAEHNADRCIGCGLCVTTCPAKSFTLLPKPEKMQYKLPEDSMDQMMALGKKRMSANSKLILGNLIIQIRIMYKMIKRQIVRV